MPLYLMNASTGDKLTTPDSSPVFPRLFSNSILEGHDIRLDGHAQGRRDGKVIIAGGRECIECCYRLLSRLPQDHEPLPCGLVLWCRAREILQVTLQAGNEWQSSQRPCPEYYPPQTARCCAALEP
jgi:hypothetical protein